MLTRACPQGYVVQVLRHPWLTDQADRLKPTGRSSGAERGVWDSEVAGARPAAPKQDNDVIPVRYNGMNEVSGMPSRQA